MKYHQRDIVEINFLFPNVTMKPHPAIVISNDEWQEIEDFVLNLHQVAHLYNVVEVRQKGRNKRWNRTKDFI